MTKLPCYQPCNLSRGTWRAIKVHVQRSYLIAREAEPDQLCVLAGDTKSFWPVIVACNVFDTEEKPSVLRTKNPPTRNSPVVLER